jgi:hypothetical protein
MKEDNRPQKYGWAHGNYKQTSCICKEPFIGEKRAVMCADCAYSKEVADFIGTEEEVFYCPHCDTPMGLRFDDHCCALTIDCSLCGYFIFDWNSTTEEVTRDIKR